MGVSTADKGTWEYLSPGNEKTGDMPSFDLPAKTTCPGMTTGPDGCGGKCYAFDRMRLFKHVAAKYERNLQLAETDGFVARMKRDLPYRATVRVHVSGDFYSAEYAAKWLEIASARTDVIFYCYTRSWKIRPIWRILRLFGELPNVELNVSCDKETGKPFKTCEPYRWCYLSHDDTAPKWMRRTDLIFRSKSNGHKRRRNNARKKQLDPNDIAPLVHRISDAPVCPKERGDEIALTCSRCRICIEPLTSAKSGVS